MNTNKTWRFLKKNRLRNAEFKLKVLTPCVDLLQ